MKKKITNKESNTSIRVLEWEIKYLKLEKKYIKLKHNTEELVSLIAERFEKKVINNVPPINNKYNEN